MGTSDTTGNEETTMTATLAQAAVTQAEHTQEESYKGVVESLLRKLHEIIPIVDHIKQSIQESSTFIPRASVQLTSVTRATEQATVEILNVVESLGHLISRAESELEALANGQQQAQAFEREFTNQLEASLRSTDNHGSMVTLSALWNQRPSRHLDTSLTETIRSYLAKAREDSTQITMALQVQDITSQQIASVLHLIETVRNQLLNTVTHPDGSGASNNHDAEPPQAFDMNAQYQPAGERQSIADSIIQQWGATQQARENL